MRTSLLLLTLLLASCDLFEDPPPFSDFSPPHTPSNTTAQRGASPETLTPYSDTLNYPSAWHETAGQRP
jgi:hypothetical protein